MLQEKLERNVLVMGFSSMLATFGNMLWFYFLPIYYAREFSASPTEISLIYAVWLTVGALGSVPAGALADLFGRKLIIVISGFVSAASIFIFAFSHNFLLSALALPVCGLGSSFYMVSNTLIAESVETGKRGTAFRYFSSTSGLVAALSPLIGGITISKEGYVPLFLVGGILTLFAALFRTAYLRETFSRTTRKNRCKDRFRKIRFCRSGNPAKQVTARPDRGI